MSVIPMFVTPLVHEKCTLDLVQLENECRTHCTKEPSVTRSNIGGLQTDKFQNRELFDLIKQSLPLVEDRPITSLKIEAWVNINNPGDYNEMHHHSPHVGTFMSGVFYVKCPPDCGNIKFYDPRPHIDSSPDMMYYEEGTRSRELSPEPNILIMFPSWLEHSVGVNKTLEDRISISFNIFNVQY